MRLQRLGSMHQSRLSFMRVLIRGLARDKWRFNRPHFTIDAKGVGHAVYSAHGPQHTYSLIAFAHDLPDSQRSDRVIAEAWDATFCLFDGIPTPDDIQRLSQNVPLQEAGRISESELILSRANRSVRLWKHVVEALAQGLQPDLDQLRGVGYLMRTTAVYGSGKFGAADREQLAQRNEFAAPFQAEMLTVYLIRVFVRDLIEHMAKSLGGANAISLDPALARELGIGNSTGLGMAPFLINHPLLINNWMVAREEARVRVESVKYASSEEVALFNRVVEASIQAQTRWHSEHPLQQKKLADLRCDLNNIHRYCCELDFQKPYPWRTLLAWSQQHLTLEGQELLMSLVLEPYGEQIDMLVSTMSDNDPDAYCIDGSMRVDQVRRLIEKCFGWAIPLDWHTRENCAKAWYISAEKLEPRLGDRFDEPVAEYEQPLAPARDAAAAYQALKQFCNAVPIAEFLLAHPEFRHVVRRLQISEFAPYAEIHNNTIAAEMLPIDMLRAKLSFFGATNFDPRSDRWVRITMYQGAPYPEELDTASADFWVYPGMV